MMQTSLLCKQSSPQHRSGEPTVSFLDFSFVRILLILAFVTFGASSSEAQLKIYYIRHAEGGHNVKKSWENFSNIPEDQWPEYVGDHTIFTPMGLTQLDRVVGKLKRDEYDYIFVSSAWRCRNTVLPYLKAVGATAEIWPELAEIYQTHLIVSPDLPPPPDVKILGAGDPIILTPEETPYFSLREDGKNDFKKAPFPRDHSESAAENAASKVVIGRAVDMLLERFSGTDKTILLVGHGSSGMGVFRLLCNKPLPRFPMITNTGIWMVEQQDNGEFVMQIYNDVPFPICD